MNPEGQVCSAGDDPRAREGEEDYWALVYRRKDEKRAKVQQAPRFELYLLAPVVSKTACFTEGPHQEDRELLHEVPHPACQAQGFPKSMCFCKPPESMQYSVVLDRKWKYDDKVEEYFVQTSDTEVLRRSELEGVTKIDSLEAVDLVN